MRDIRKIVRRKIKNTSGRTIFWGMQLLPKAKREALYTLLAFVRHLEDVVESPISLAEKQEILGMWREELDNIFDRRVPATDIGRRIYKNCMRFKLPKAEFLNLVDSISANIDNPLQAPTLQQLSGYCRGVGGMTGSLSLRVFGCTDENVIKELSTALGLSLQITTILINVKEDAQNDRLYIPQELLQKAGISATDPKSVVVDKNLARARRDNPELWAMARTHIVERRRYRLFGIPVITRVSTWRESRWLLFECLPVWTAKLLLTCITDL